MNDEDISKEISDLNLNYMLLAQKLLRKDRAAAMLRLGISRELADMLVGMSLAQIVRLAATNFVLCSFRLDGLPAAVAAPAAAKDASLHQAHISIVLAARQNEMSAVGGHA